MLPREAECPVKKGETISKTGSEVRHREQNLKNPQMTELQSSVIFLVTLEKHFITFEIRAMGKENEGSICTTGMTVLTETLMSWLL